MEAKKQIDKKSDDSSMDCKAVIGINGSLNSMVAAYLLKIQKFELVAVSVVPSWDNFSGDSSSSLNCHVDAPKVEMIRNFCHQLAIPHHVVKMNDEFVENIVEQWISSRITAEANNSCFSCHELRMRILFEKARKLGISKVATGHSAKLFHNEVRDTFFVHSSNDESIDQSIYLARLPQAMLRHLLLPLSDLVQKEIHKLAENFGITVESLPLEKESCFKDNASLKYLNERVPKNMNRPGEVVSLSQDRLGEHTGILNYEYGSPIKIDNANNDEKIFVDYSINENKLVVSNYQYFYHKSFMLNNCFVTKETLWDSPSKVFIRIDSNNWKEGIIYPKNFSSAWVELQEECKVKQGQLVHVFRKKAKNSKLLVSGYIKFFVEPPNPDEESRHEIQVNHNIDL